MAQGSCSTTVVVQVKIHTLISNTSVVCLVPGSRGSLSTQNARAKERTVHLQALLQSSHMYYDAKNHFEGHGVVVEGVKVDLAKMMEQKKSSVDGLTKGIEGLFKKNKVEYVKGWGSLIGAF